MKVPGTYDIKVLEAAMCRAESGTDYVGAICIVFDDGGTEIGRVPWSGFLSEKTRERTAKALTLLGWDGIVAEDGSISSLTKKVKAGIIDEEYRNRLTTKVDWIGEPPFGVELKSKDRLTLSQAKSQIADLQKLCGVGANAGPARF